MRIIGALMGTILGMFTSPVWADIDTRSATLHGDDSLSSHFIRIQPFPDDPDYVSFQVCKNAQEDYQVETGIGNRDPYRVCSNVYGFEWQITGFRSPDALDDRKHFVHFWNMGQLLKKNEAVLKALSSERTHAVALSIAGGALVGSFLPEVLGFQSALGVYGVGLLSGYFVDKTLDSLENTQKRPSIRAWDYFSGFKTFNVGNELHAILTSEVLMGEESVWLRPCTLEQAEQKRVSRGFDGGCVSLFEAALLIQAVLQDLARSTFVHASSYYSSSTYVAGLAPGFTLDRVQMQPRKLDTNEELDVWRLYKTSQSELGNYALWNYVSPRELRERAQARPVP